MRRFYWFKDGLPQSVAILGIAVLYPLFIFLMGDAQRGFLEYLEMATWYLVAMAVFMPVIFNLLIYGTTVPLTLSLGATRKEAWTGLQLYRLAMLLPLLGGVVLLAVLGATVDFWLVFVLLLSGYLFFGGIGGILGVLSTKLSRGALVAVTAAISTCSLAVAAVAALLTVLAEQVAFSLIFILPVVGLLVYVACTCFEKRPSRPFVSSEEACMLKRFFKGLKLHAQTPLTLLISTLLLFVVGLGFLCFIMILVEEEDGWIPLGSLLALVSLVIFTVVNYMNYPREFMLALSLGQTRKEFLLSHVLGRLLWTTLAYGVVLLLTWLECGLCRFLFSQTEEVFALMPILTDGRVILTAIPALVLLEMFCGALYSRFGKPVNVVIYILWMSLAMSVSQWAHRIVLVFQGLAAFWIPLGIIGMSVMAFVVIYLGRNQGVR